MSDDLPDPFSITVISSAPESELIHLYKDAGWWESSYDNDSKFLTHIVKNSALFVGVFYENRLIGMGRALSDLASDAYIQDVAVLKEFRRKGLGRKIIQKLIQELKKEGVDWIGLIAEPGTESFYSALGFDVLKGHVPLKYKDR